jgi:8-oxo-dGTP diphosphatase
MIRRVGPAPEPQRKYTFRPGAYAILPLDGGVLLTCQSGDAPDIQLPGGGIDPGEGPVRALHREVFEETGWRIAQLRRLGAFKRFVYMPEYDMWAEKVCHIFCARPTRRICDPIEPEHAAKWMCPKDAAIKLSNEGDRLFLTRYFS